ncbi:MAG: FAD-dependent oxidoreductase [Muribaculaceae bacterium]|nr:FAD-dependent oxidoreductase [Muribaculaceae bacterium]
MQDVIIIGSGPAGLSAAVYSKRAGLTMLVIEKNAMSGGQVLNTDKVDNYLGIPGINGFELGMKFRSHAEEMGAVFVSGEVKSITGEKGRWIVTVHDGAEKTAYETKTVIIAAGASHALLHVPGEERLAGRGVSYCATCDGAFFRKKNVAVVGGGDVAVEDAIFLSRICNEVILIHRRDSLRAAKSLQEALFQCANVKVIWDSVVEEICGDEKVEALKVRCLKDDTCQMFKMDGVFIAVGLLPNTEPFRDIVACDEKGYIIAGEDCATQTAGIFAAGDIRTKRVRQIITAAADGAAAIAGIEGFLLQGY